MRAASNDDEGLVGVEREGFFEGSLLSGADGFKLGADGDASPNIVRVLRLYLLRDGHTEGDFFGFFHEEAVGETGDGVGLVDDVGDFEEFYDDTDGKADVAAFEENDVGAGGFGEEAKKGGDEPGEETKKTEEVAQD